VLDETLALIAYQASLDKIEIVRNLDPDLPRYYANIQEIREIFLNLLLNAVEAVEAKGRDVWSLEASAIRADAHEGSAHWEARYRFSATGRLVHNRIDATFVFRDGLVVRHIDQFDVWRWSRQALGTPGLLLGWSGVLRRKIREQAGARLAAWRPRPR
jgi:UDP-N-acetylmuramate-alanine ligase